MWICSEEINIRTISAPYSLYRQLISAGYLVVLLYSLEGESNDKSLTAPPVNNMKTLSYFILAQLNFGPKGTWGADSFRTAKKLGQTGYV